MLINVSSSGDPGPAAMSTLYNASPIAHVSTIEAPIYLMIGAKDKRVPPSQGQSLYNELNCMGNKNVRMNVYDDCHPLSKVAVHSNVMLNAVVFYNEFNE